MTDREVYEKFMLWMGMTPTRSVTTLEGITAVIYEDKEDTDSRFEAVGYDEFNAAAMFDSKGNMVKGCIDSHVAWGSDNYVIIDKFIDEQTIN